MRPLYQRLGLSVGVIQTEMGADERRAAYACDITYCTNKQLVFDYLKDSLLLQGRRDALELSLLPLIEGDATLHKLLLRGLNFAILDEADSILVDEARTPLILSQTVTETATSETHDERKLYQKALQVAGHLQENQDFSVDQKARRINLTHAGLHHMNQCCDPLGGF